MTGRRRSGALVVAGLLLATPAAAQLRPFSPLDWSAFDSPRPVSVGIGVGTLRRQIMSLAGTRGDLLEIGRFQASWWSGRMGVEAEGTLYRRFEDRAVLGPPATGTKPSNGAPRTDAGDVVATTVIRLSPERSRLHAALRFGTRLPTASDEPGLERDRTDFFAAMAGRYRSGRLAVGGEGGVGLLGTRVDGVDQLDVITFAGFAETRIGPVTATGSIVGHDDLHRGVVRGSEDLSELRLAVRVGERNWISATVVRGIAEHSPGAGLYVMAGIRR